MNHPVNRKRMPRARHAVSHRGLSVAVAILLGVGVSGCAPQPTASDPDPTPSQATTEETPSATTSSTSTRSASATPSATDAATPTRSATGATASATDTATPTQSATGATPSGTKKPTASQSAATFVLPETREDAIANARLTAGSNMSTSGDGALKGVTYMVHAACDGRTGDTMSYELVVDDQVVSGGLWSCGSDIMNSGFESRGGEMVQIRLLPDTDTGKFDSMVEVVPSTP